MALSGPSLDWGLGVGCHGYLLPEEPGGGYRSSSILTLTEKDSPVKDLLLPPRSKNHLLLPLVQRQEWTAGHVCTPG